MSNGRECTSYNIRVCFDAGEEGEDRRGEEVSVEAKSRHAGAVHLPHHLQRVSALRAQHPLANVVRTVDEEGEKRDRREQESHKTVVADHLEAGGTVKYISI